MRLFIILLLFVQLTYSQNNFNRLDLISIKEYYGEFNDSTDIIILENDTLIAKSKKLEEFKISPQITNDSLVLDYFYLTAFRNKRNLVFWKKPIIVHLSDDFSQNIKTDLKNFANKLNHTGVVNISFTDDKEKSNLVIINIPFIVNNYSKDLWQSLPTKQAQKLLFYNAGYNLFRQDSEIYAGAIKINLNRFEDEEIISYKLKRLLYASMGFFTNHELMSDEMFLKTIPTDTTDFSEYDELMLRIHYDHRTSLNVNSYDIYKLYKAQ